MQINNYLKDRGLTPPEIQTVLSYFKVEDQTSIKTAEAEIHWEFWLNEVAKHKRKLKEKKPFFLLPFTIEFKWRNKND